MPSWSDERGDLTEHRQIGRLHSQPEHIEEREDPPFELIRPGDFLVEDTVTASADPSYAEGRSEELWEFPTDLRDVEGEPYAERKATITLTTDRDVEAALSVDEPRDVVTHVERDLIQPGWRPGPFLLIVRTGRIVTAHVPVHLSMFRTLRRGCDTNEYRRILGVSSI
jgi:hypothetical protein